MNEVTVTILPHPITMFILGGMLLGIIILFLEFSKTRNVVKELLRRMEKSKEIINSISENTSKSIQDVSRKVDSRIDKALGNTKKD